MKKIILTAGFIVLATMQSMAQTVEQVFDQFATAENVMDMAFDGMGSMFGDAPAETLIAILDTPLMADAIDSVVAEKGGAEMTPEQRQLMIKHVQKTMLVVFQTDAMRLMVTKQCTPDVQRQFAEAVRALDFSGYTLVEGPEEDKDKDSRLYIKQQGDRVTELLSYSISPEGDAGLVSICGHFDRNKVEDLVQFVIENAADLQKLAEE